MISRDMSKKEFKGEQKATRGRGPKHKVYCIFEKEGYIYFPVAAKWSPYSLIAPMRRSNPLPKKESYLAGMPGFFGGNIEGRESAEETLAREIREESQGRIDVEIPAGTLGEPVFISRPQKTDMDQNTYDFYILRSEKCSINNFQWGEEDVFRLRSFEEGERHAKDHPECYEDSFLVRMENTRFRTVISSLYDLKDVSDEGVRQVRVGEILEGAGIEFIASLESVRNWYGSHTSIAFMESLSRI